MFLVFGADFPYGVEEVDWDEKAFGAKDAKRSALSQKHSHPSGRLKREKKIEEKRETERREIIEG
jgi:hypothetical protein